MTHHVELVLPGASFLVRMLDGRIDTQGLIKDLRAQGVLEDITHDANVDAHEEAVAAAEVEATEAPDDEDVKPDKKPARKLVKDEHREEGSVKWSIYKRYLQARWDPPSVCSRATPHTFQARILCGSCLWP